MLFLLKSQDTKGANKGLHSQSYGFSNSHVWVWELIIKKAECWRTNAFKLQCWGRLLKVPWTARSNQSILKEINPKYSLEELMLKVKVQYFGHLILIGKDPDPGKDWRPEEKQVTEDEMVGWHHRKDMRLSKIREIAKPGVLQSLGSQRVRHDRATEQQWQCYSCNSQVVGKYLTKRM